MTATHPPVRLLVHAPAVYTLGAWIWMLILGGLHSWQPMIPAVPFWPMLGLLYLFSSLVGLATWVVIWCARAEQ